MPDRGDLARSWRIWVAMMIHIVRLVVLLLSAFAAAASFAAVPSIYKYRDGNNVRYDTPQLACEGNQAIYNQGSGPYVVRDVVAGAGTTTGPCNASLYYKSSGAFAFSSNIGGWTRVTVCPPNATMVNGVCQCSSGYKEQGGQCVPDGPQSCVQNAEWNGTTCVCKAGYEQTDGSDGPLCRPIDVHQKHCDEFGPGKNENIKVRSSGIRSSDGAYCHVPFYSVPGLQAGEGCVAYVGSGIKTKDDDGTWWYQGSSTGSSEKCTGSLTSEDPSNTDGDAKPDSCPHGYAGTVNGVEVCIAHEGEKGIEGIDKTKVTNPDGTSTETTKEVKCEGGKCTTTETTTTKDANGNVTGTSTKVTEDTVAGTCAKNPGTTVCSAVGKDQGVLDALNKFCQQNPTIGMCKKASGNGNGSGGNGDGDSESSFSGNCESGFVAVSDDAVLNAVAKEQHIRNCNFFDKVPEPTEDTNDADDMRAKGKAGTDQTNDLPEGLRKSVEISGSDFDTTSVIGAQACFTDKTVSVFGKTIAIPLSIVCPWLDILGNLLMVVGWILAARIVIRG